MSLTPGCEPECRGCFHRDISVEESMSQKNDWLRKVFGSLQDKIAAITHLPWEQQVNYRDKVSLNAVWKEDHWVFGMHHKGHIVPIPDCPIHTRQVFNTMRILSKHLPGPDQLPLKFYVQSGAQLVLVVHAKKLEGFSWPEDLFRELMEAGNQGVWLHLNPHADKKVFGRNEWHFLFGKQRSMNIFHLIYGPMTYQQIIPEFYKKALSYTLRFFNFEEGDGIADLYCGTGGSLVAWTRAGAEGIGIDINGEAAECARMNVRGTLVLRGKCAARLNHVNEWIEYKAIKRFFVYANPPKNGIEQEVLAWITDSSRPFRMGYMSCNAAVLAKEAAILVQNGYKLTAVYPFDTYPRTHHIECLALFEDQKASVKTVSSPATDLT